MALRATSTVHPLDFGQLSGHDFERLVFALLWRRWPWSRLDWYGQLGDDGGRDIWGLRENDWGRTELIVVACANWKNLTTKKALGDVEKVASGRQGRPEQLIIVAGGKVSADLKTKVTAKAQRLGIYRVEVWSGPELEELLRHHAASVLRRFYEGEVLPDEPAELRDFVVDTRFTDDEALGLLGRFFDRPAFQTPFHGESSLPAFRRAISDTIEAINTGIYRTRDGTIIGHFPSKHDFRAKEIREVLDTVVQKLNQLRMAFDDHLRKGDVRPYGAGDDCSTFDVGPRAAFELDELRHDVLEMVGRVVPGLAVPPGLGPFRFHAPSRVALQEVRPRGRVKREGPRRRVARSRTR